MGKLKLHYYAVIAAFTLFIWILDATVTYFLSYPTFTYPGILYLHIPTADLVHRTILSIIAFVTAYFLYHNREQVRLIEKSSAEQDERYRLISTYSNDVLWTIDFDGNFTFVSPAIKRLLGFTPEELIKINFEQTLAQGSLKIATELFGHFKDIIVNEPGKIPSVVTELELVTKSGGTVWVEASITTIPGSIGKPMFFLGVSRDISRKKKKRWRTTAKRGKLSSAG